MKLKMMKVLLDNLTTEQLNDLGKIEFANRRIIIRTKLTPTLSKMLHGLGVQLKPSPLGFLDGVCDNFECEIRFIVNS